VEDAYEFARLIRNHMMRVIKGANHCYTTHHREHSDGVVEASGGPRNWWQPRRVYGVIPTPVLVPRAACFRALCSRLALHCSRRASPGHRLRCLGGESAPGRSHHIQWGMYRQIATRLRCLGTCFSYDDWLEHEAPVVDSSFFLFKHVCFYLWYTCYFLFRRR
jgi:hypothetical protein